MTTSMAADTTREYFQSLPVVGVLLAQGTPKERTVTTQECAAIGEMMGGMMGPMMSGGMTSGPMISGGPWGGLWWFGLLILAVIVAVGLALTFALVRRSVGQVGDDPRDILRRRFARGELSGDDLEAALKTLG
jgi:uncharacterized membrane protein